MIPRGSGPCRPLGSRAGPARPHRTRHLSEPVEPVPPAPPARGCKRGDLAHLVERERVEGALGCLRDAGVYLTFDEFKGRRDVERGSQRFRFRESDFDAPYQSPGLMARSGYTRGACTRVRPACRFSEIWRTPRARARCSRSRPRRALGLARLGSHHPPSLREARAVSAGVVSSPRAALARPAASAAYVSALSRMTPCPRAAPSVPWPSIGRRRWPGGSIARARESLPVCLTTYASSAVRIARSARECGLDLTAVSFVTLGEPFTDAKRATVEAVGARALVRYAFTEAGIIGFACGTPRASDDLHFYRNAYALTQRTRTVRTGGRPSRPSSSPRSCPRAEGLIHRSARRSRVGS